MLFQDIALSSSFSYPGLGPGGGGGGGIEEQACFTSWFYRVELQIVMIFWQCFAKCVFSIKAQKIRTKSAVTRNSGRLKCWKSVVTLADYLGSDFMQNAISVENKKKVFVC